MIWGLCWQSLWGIFRVLFGINCEMKNKGNVIFCVLCVCCTIVECVKGLFMGLLRFEWITWAQSQAEGINTPREWERWRGSKHPIFVTYWGKRFWNQEAAFCFSAIRVQCIVIHLFSNAFNSRCYWMNACTTCKWYFYSANWYCAAVVSVVNIDTNNGYTC